MLQPTPEQLALLSPGERLTFRLAEVASRLPAGAFGWNNALMSVVIGACGRRRLDVRGLENITALTPRDSVLFVANHRSFFDFYLLVAVLLWNTGLRPRIRFPVRSTFFYDHPLGPFVNMAMSGMRMFPPLMREREKAGFNRFALARCVEELKVPGTAMGMHPEGTRNKGPDPYAFLPAQPGLGKVVLEAPNVRVVPVFVLGMSNSMGTEFVRNMTAPGENPICLAFGPELDFADLRARGSRASLYLRASNRCLDAIRKLAEEHRARHEGARRDGAVAVSTP